MSDESLIPDNQIRLNTESFSGSLRPGAGLPLTTTELTLEITIDLSSPGNPFSLLRSVGIVAENVLQYMVAYRTPAGLWVNVPGSLKSDQAADFEAGVDASAVRLLILKQPTAPSLSLQLELFVCAPSGEQSYPGSVLRRARRIL